MNYMLALLDFPFGSLYKSLNLQLTKHLRQVSFRDIEGFIQSLVRKW